MKLTDLIIFSIALVCTGQSGLAQTSVEVSRPGLSMKDNGIQISYDILNSAETDEFSIRVEVSDAKGRLIEARSLSGDIGENVRGGIHKEIFWDIVADSIFLDEEIFVQVYALAKPKPVVVEQVAEVKDQSSSEETEKIEDRPETDLANTASQNTFNRTLIVLQSVVLPGLGLSRVKPGQPHWIRGVAGYGCIAGALYFNNKAVASYDSYMIPDRLEDVDDLYNKAVKQDAISEVLAFVALGVWVSDLIWTIIGTSDMNLSHPSVNHKGLTIGTSFEPVSSVPLIAFRYKF